MPASRMQEPPADTCRAEGGSPTESPGGSVVGRNGRASTMALDRLGGVDRAGSAAAPRSSGDANTGVRRHEGGAGGPREARLGNSADACGVDWVFNKIRGLAGMVSGAGLFGVILAVSPVILALLPRILVWVSADPAR